jgi:hypothetical protein
VPTSVTVTAVYASQFPNNSSSQQATVTIIPPTGTAAATLTASPNITNIGSAEALTVSISVVGSPTPTGIVSLLNGGNVLGTANLVSGAASITASGLPVGNDTLTVNYSGDTVYRAANSTFAVTVISSSTPGFTLNGTKVAVTCGATTNNTSTITLSSVAGFSGTVTLTADISGFPNGTSYFPTLSFGSTSSPTLAANATTTGTLTVSTTAKSADLKLPPRPGYETGAAVLACLICFLVPRRRTWMSVLGLLVLAIALISGVASCGGGGGSSGGNGGTGGGGGAGVPGTTIGTYIVKITGTSGSTVNANTITLVVQ